MKRFKITAAEKKNILATRARVGMQGDIFDVFIEEFAGEDFLDSALSQKIPATKKALSKFFDARMKEIVSGARKSFKRSLPYLISDLKEMVEKE